MVTPTERSRHYSCAVLSSFNTPAGRSAGVSPLLDRQAPSIGSIADEKETKPSPYPVTTVSIAFDASLATQRFGLLFCYAAPHLGTRRRSRTIRIAAPALRRAGRGHNGTACPRR